jgi:DHA1 family bicyclomycin/chloramphenicol resistance-like MFS transporter
MLILGGLASIGPFSIDMYLPSLPSVARDLHTQPALVQLSLTTCLAGLALGQLVAGPLSDRLGRRRPLLVGLVVYILAAIVCAISPSVGILIVARAAQGLAGAAGIVIANAIVADLYTGRAAARFFSRLMLVSGLAPIIAPLVGGQILRITTWRGVFTVLAGFGLLLLIAVAARLPETHPAGRRQFGGVGETLRTFAALARGRVFLGYTLASGLAFSAMFAYIAGAPFVYQNVYGVSPQMFSLLFGANSLGLMLAGQANGFALRVAAPRRLLVSGLTVALLAGALLLAAALIGGFGLAGVAVPLFVLLCSLGFVSPNATALALEIHPNSAGSAAGVFGMLSFLGGAIAAPLVGLGGDRTALPMAIVIAALTAVALAAYGILVAGSPAPSSTPSGPASPAVNATASDATK